MQRKNFLLQTMLAIPALAIHNYVYPKSGKVFAQDPFLVDKGKSRFGDTVKFLGVHPNDLKISSKDTGGQLSVFEYTGLSKAGPAMHLHYHQDEIFNITEGSFRFVVGQKEHILTAGQTIFLPRNIPHTWLQLSDYGRMIYFLQPAGKMEEFFTVMSKLTTPPSEAEVSRIHELHGMKLVGPPLTAQ